MILAIFISACILMVLCVLKFPTVKIKKKEIDTYWIPPLAGAILALIISGENRGEILSGLIADTSVNPVKILVLFISMTGLSIFLDETGFFSYVAGETVKRANCSQKRIFFYLYITVSVLTVFTSNDIIILTFTPFICCFAKRMRINPMPYLFAEFAGANTWSIFLIIGNPTNIYLASLGGIGFAEYIKLMWLPAVVAGLTAFAVTFLMFRKDLEKPMSPKEFEFSRIKDKVLLGTGLFFLSVCIILLAVSSYISLEMWIITLGIMALEFITVLIYCAFKRRRPKELVRCLKRMTYLLIPFVLSMFILVEALSGKNVTAIMGQALNSLGHSGIVYGFASALMANFVNNIPMSVLFESVISSSGAGREALLGAIVGSNIGALITPVGALAGIMWSGILKSYEVKFSVTDFIKYGGTIALFSLIFSTIIL
ncbi:MAG: hypothetical protein J5984_01015 [Clostridia bacterium]|nr:hypothetical protein [Clostridia bacterium]